MLSFTGIGDFIQDGLGSDFQKLRAFVQTAQALAQPGPSRDHDLLNTDQASEKGGGGAFSHSRGNKVHQRGRRVPVIFHRPGS
jgi:hypothetical protein